MPSIYASFLGFVQLSLHAFSELTCIGQLKLVIFISNSRKMILLQIQVSQVPCNVLCMLNLIYDFCLLSKPCFSILVLDLLLACSIVIVCHRMCYDCASSHVCHPFFMSYHSRIIHCITLMHTSHSCIIVTETPESETIEPTEFVEPEPDVEFVADPEENQGKQLSMIPCAYLN